MIRVHVNVVQLTDSEAGDQFRQVEIDRKPDEFLADKRPDDFGGFVAQDALGVKVVRPARCARA